MQSADSWGQTFVLMEKLADNTFASFVGQKKEPAWLKDYRQRNFEAFKAYKFAKWPYTDLNRLQEMLSAPTDAAKIQFEGKLPKGAELLTLQEALAKQPELVKKYIEKERIIGDKFELFTNAFFTDGYFLHLPKAAFSQGFSQKALPKGADEKFSVKVQIDLPKGNACLKSIVAMQQENSVELLEQITSTSNANGFLAANATFYIDNASSLEFEHFNDLAEGTTGILAKRLFVGRDSKVNSVYGWFGSKLTKSAIGNHMVGPGSEVHHYEIAFGTGNQHFDLTSDAHHEVPDTSAFLALRAALNDKASSIFNGMVKIHKPAQHTNSFLEAHSLLLSKDASSNNIPGLEIEANDVKASHSASVHKIEDDKVFYLTTRGIDEFEARKLIISSFLETLVYKIKDEKIREIFADKIRNKYRG